MYSYDDIFLFIKIIDIGSFIDTAKILKISQSTVSRRMKALENSLGLKLFKQHNKGFELTEIGKLLYHDFRDKHDELNSLVNKCIIPSNSLSGKLKIILPPALAMDLIAPFLPDFLEQYPNINLDISFQTEKVDLVKEGFDIAVEIINHTEDFTLAVSGFVFSSEYNLYCTKKYKKKYGIPKTPKDLQKHFMTAFMLDGGKIASTVEFIHKKTKAVTIIELPGQIASNNITQNLKMLYSDEIIVGLYDFVAAKKDIDIIKVLPEYSMGMVSYCIVTHPYQNNEITSLFCDFIKKLLKL